MYLGHSAPGVDEIEAVVQRRNEAVQREADGLSYPEREQFQARHGLLGFRDFSRAVGKADRWKAQLAKTGWTDADTPAGPVLHEFLRKWFDEDRHPPTLQGWVQYLCDVCPAIADRLPLNGHPLTVPEGVRDMHTLITAASGQGKSEVLKTLIHHYVAHDSAAVVVLDPHGVMAGEIARWPDFAGKDRLVYVEPGFEPGCTVGINPLDGRGLDEPERAKLAELIGDAIGELSSDLTNNMQAVATGCARLLLEDGNATFFDLLDLLANPPKKGAPDTDTTENRARLIAKGQAHPDRAMRWFFDGQFEDDSLKAARNGIKNRLFLRLLSPGFQHMTCGRPTLNLQELIRERKVIVCNLLPLGAEGAAAMGRLIVALVAGIGFRRGGTPESGWTPCHVIVDEAQTMASPTMATILFELRKFRIHLTLSQQVEGVNFDDVGQKAIANSTAIKFVGSHLKAPLRPVFGDDDPPETKKLKPGQFWMRWGRDGTPTLVNVRSEFAKVAKDAPPPYRMMDAEWQAVRAQMLRYYRPAIEAEPPKPKVRLDAPAGVMVPIAPVVRPAPAAIVQPVAPPPPAPGKPWGAPQVASKAIAASAAPKPPEVAPAAPSPAEPPPDPPPRPRRQLR